jgi:hypothetical protein
MDGTFHAEALPSLDGRVLHLLKDRLGLSTSAIGVRSLEVGELVSRYFACVAWQVRLIAVLGAGNL